MNCGCTKNLGCFIPGQNIDFGILAPYDGFYTAEIFSNSGFTSISFEGDFGTPLVLPFTFNENSTTIIKIKFDVSFAQYGMYYATTKDGACSFEVSGIIPQC
jgi:hypothetical protein